MERKLNMSKFKPYKDHRGLVKFKSFKERKMSWPKTMEKYVLDGKYLLRPVREDEIGEVVEIYRVGFPELYGHHRVVLWSDTLRELLETGNGFMKGDYSLLVAEKLDEKKLVAAIFVRMDKGNMSIRWEHGVIHPDHRSTKGLFRAICTHNDELSERTGAEYGSLLACTFHVKTQIALKNLGWKIRGVFPGYILSWNHDDKYYRQSVVIFDKFFNDGKELVPKEMDLIAEAEKIFKLSEEL